MASAWEWIKFYLTPPWKHREPPEPSETSKQLYKAVGHLLADHAETKMLEKEAQKALYKKQIMEASGMTEQELELKIQEVRKKKIEADHEEMKFKDEWKK